MNTKPWLKNSVAWTLLTVCLFANNAGADCDSTANTHYPTQMPANYQGSAQTDSFDCAVNGNKQLTLDQLRERADLIPPNLDNRYYVRLGFNAAAEGVIMAKTAVPDSQSSNPPATTGTVTTTNYKIADNNFEMAFGYTWAEFAVDLEWLSLKSIAYSTTITGLSEPVTFNSTIKGNSLLLNIYWFFSDLYNVKVYGLICGGYSNNTSTSTLNGGSITKMTRYYPNAGLGIGARFNIFSRLYADFAGRAIWLGPLKMSANNGSINTLIKAQRSWLGADARLLWLI
jgi:hypothetical protein